MRISLHMGKHQSNAQNGGRSNNQMIGTNFGNNCEVTIETEQLIHLKYIVKHHNKNYSSN